METINIKIDLTDYHNNRFQYHYNNDFNSTPEYFQALQKWRKSKDNTARDLYTDMITGAVNSSFDAVNYAIFDRTIHKAIDNAVKQAAIKTGGTWTD